MLFSDKLIFLGNAKLKKVKLFLMQDFSEPWMCKSEMQRDGYNAQFSANASDHRTFLDVEHTLRNTLENFISFLKFIFELEWYGLQVIEKLNVI